MFRKIILPFCAIFGIGFSVFMMYWGALGPPEHVILFQPPQSPYEHYVSGEGMIEAYEKSIKIGVAFPDLIMEVPVDSGDEVKKGDLLFRVDTRQQEADLKQAKVEFKAAKTVYEDKAQQFIFYEQLQDKAAISQQEYTQAFYAKQKALDDMRVALANILRIKMIIERAHIRAPYDGVVLDNNARVGKFANVNPFDASPLLVFGRTGTWQLRVHISEEDAWRVIPHAPGIAFVRGNADIQFPLTFKYIEPLLESKTSLTGSDFERVDTRVLQIVYEFQKGNAPVYIGQLLDVYLEAQPSKHI